MLGLMVDLAPDPAERSIRDACAAGDVAGATTAALRRYGPELLGFLVGVHGDYDEASEAFAVFSEKLWSTMARFEWRCSLRTWCYRLVRQAAVDVRRGDRRQAHVGLSSVPEVMELATRVRTETLSFLRTANRTALESLRDELPEEDRALLVLRVDRELEWREIAIVLANASSRSDRVENEAALKREAARLRKRFQLVTERLRALARERKLL
jgi:RNA polymerase sigma-70 factor (ECF subfamily)